MAWNCWSKWPESFTGERAGGCSLRHPWAPNSSWKKCQGNGPLISSAQGGWNHWMYNDLPKRQNRTPKFKNPTKIAVTESNLCILMYFFYLFGRYWGDLVKKSMVPRGQAVAAQVRCWTLPATAGCKRPPAPGEPHCLHRSVPGRQDAPLVEWGTLPSWQSYGSQGPLSSMI